jgi:hypothetical protein
MLKPLPQIIIPKPIDLTGKVGPGKVHRYEVRKEPDRYFGNRTNIPINPIHDFFYNPLTKYEHDPERQLPDEFKMQIQEYRLDHMQKHQHNPMQAYDASQVNSNNSYCCNNCSYN